MSIIKIRKGARTMQKNKIIKELARLLVRQNLISDSERLKLLKVIREE